MTPDPQIVREIAREHIRSGRSDIGTTVVKHFGNGALSDEEYGDWYHAVVQAWRIELRAVSWPDEQQLDGAVRRVEAYLGAHRPDRERKSADVIATLPNPEGPGWRHLSGVDLRTVLAERDALAKRVAELEWALADVDMTFRLPHGGAWCAACRQPMREGATVVKTLAVVCQACAGDLAATAGRLNPAALAARSTEDAT